MIIGNTDALVALTHTHKQEKQSDPLDEFTEMASAGLPELSPTFMQLTHSTEVALHQAAEENRWLVKVNNVTLS